MRPQLLGFIFDTLAPALELKPTIKLRDLPRMADFALWCEAIARVMGYKELEFLKAYYENIGKQNVEAIQNHPLGQVIVKYIEEYESCQGSASELLDLLESYAIQKSIKTDHRLWPKAANSFTRRLNQIRSNLLEGADIDVQVSRITGNGNEKANTSSIKISKISPIPPKPPTDQNHEGNQAKLPGNVDVPGDAISPVCEIPPVRKNQNRAQGDIGDGST
jgi:hypothetical protein